MDDFSDVNESSFVVSSDEEDFDEEEDDHELTQGSQSSNVRMGLNSNQTNNHPQVDPLTLSQDHDFQSQNQMVMRPRIGAAQANVPEPCPRNVETEVSMLELHSIRPAWNIKVTDRYCIFKWIAQRGREGIVKCPECNYPAKRKEVRRIWSKAVVVVDTAERDEAVSRAKKEQESRIRSEQKLANSTLALEMLKSEMAKLQKKHDHQRTLKRKYRKELKRLNFNNPQMGISRRSSYSFYRTTPLHTTPIGSSHYMSYRKDEEMLVCSRQIGDTHGIAKISMRDFSNNLHSMIPIHQQPIRDVQCYTNDSYSNKSLVLTASADNTLKLTSAALQQSVISYDLKAPVWSCCWSTSNPLIVYCSVKAKQTSILTLDLRNTSGPIANFNQADIVGDSPIHSMAHIGPSQSQDCEGILCGNLKGAFIYNPKTGTQTGSLSQGSLKSASQVSLDQSMNRDSDQGALLRLPGGGCSSVSFDPQSRRWMASYKFHGQAPTQHVRGYLDQDVVSGNLKLNSEFYVMGGPNLPRMARNSIFSRNDGSIHMAAGSVDMVKRHSLSEKLQDAQQSQLTHHLPLLTFQAYLWRGTLESWVSEDSSSQISKGDNFVDLFTLKRQGYQENQHTDPIWDIKPVVIGHDEYIATLSDNELDLHRWSEVQSGFSLPDDSETEDSDDDIPDDMITDSEPSGTTDKGKRRRTSDDGDI
ncbi:RING finger and WD repeat domain-containing protein 3 [Entomortierella chlamydospora]|nr:RING finger and WD repeat domain-containing protein 3 [Entomortierella chlamydospora]